MTEKDPKDMTAAELLRWAANGEPNEYGNTVVHFKLFSALSGKPYDETTCDDDAHNLRALADKIDAEIADAVASAQKPMNAIRRIIALGTDWPEPRVVEGLKDWLERCWLPRPRYDDTGDPVDMEDFGDPESDDFAWYTVSDSGDWAIYAQDTIEGSESERVKRPAPEALGADGLPIVAGETVYPIDGDWIGCPLEVESIGRDGSVRVSLFEGKGWTNYLADRLTHTPPPDAQQRIDADVMKEYIEYWGCVGMNCEGCPAKIDGEKPWKRYGVSGCHEAMTLDLLRRQRELDARKGGE